MTAEFYATHVLRYILAAGVLCLMLGALYCGSWAFFKLGVLGRGSLGEAHGDIGDRVFGLLWGGVVLCFGLGLSAIDGALWGILK